MNELNQINIEKTLSKIIHPEINYSLVDLGMIEDVVSQQKHVSLTLKLPLLQVPMRERY